MLQDARDEIDTIEALATSSAVARELVIPAAVVWASADKSAALVAMPRADGDLADLLAGTMSRSEQVALRILRLAFDAVYDVYNATGFIYHDLKLNNMLYSCAGGGLSVFLADYGGFAREGEVVYSTFPHFTVVESGAVAQRNTQPAAVYALGVLFLAAVDEDNYFHFGEDIEAARRYMSLYVRPDSALHKLAAWCLCFNCDTGQFMRGDAAIGARTFKALQRRLMRVESDGKFL